MPWGGTWGGSGCPAEPPGAGGAGDGADGGDVPGLLLLPGLQRVEAQTERTEHPWGCAWGSASAGACVLRPPSPSPKRGYVGRRKQRVGGSTGLCVPVPCSSAVPSSLQPRVPWGPLMGVLLFHPPLPSPPVARTGAGHPLPTELAAGLGDPGVPLSPSSLLFCPELLGPDPGTTGGFPEVGDTVWSDPQCCRGSEAEGGVGNGTCVSPRQGRG